MDDHRKYMRKAIALAKKIKGSCSPNPAVGAIIVKDNSIIAYGATKKAGDDHAEVVAIKNAKKKYNLRNTTLYVTLEPCSFFGKTPPCVDLIIKEKIKTVVIASIDKNPRVNGKSIDLLKKAGITVIYGLEEEKANRINEDFNKFITSNMPFCIAKYAMTIDGKIATDRGKSKWISNENARIISHKLRNTVDAIMIGASTLIQDNPKLNVRLKRNKHKDPLRIIVANNENNIRADLEVITDSEETLFVLKQENKHCSRKLRTILEDTPNKEILYESGNDEHNINLRWLFEELAKRNIVSVLIEGGSRLLSSAVDAKLVDKVICFIAPKIIKGSKYPPFKENGVDCVADAIVLKDTSYKKIGDNIMFVGYAVYECT